MYAHSLDTLKASQILEEAGAEAGLAQAIVKVYDEGLLIHADTFATKEDLKVLEANLKSEIAEFRSEVKTEIADLRTEMGAEIAAVRTEIANSRTQMIVWIGGIFAFVQACMFLALKYIGLAPPV